MTNLYAQAIDLITRDDLDCRAIAIALAKSHPSIFVKIATYGDHVFIEQVDRLLKDGKVINAIKEWRAKHGSGLAEAKTEIDKRRAILGV